MCFSQAKKLYMFFCRQQIRTCVFRRQQILTYVFFAGNKFVHLFFAGNTFVHMFFCRQRIINQAMPGLPAKHWPVKMIILVSDFLGCLKILRMFLQKSQEIFCSSLEISFDLIPADILGSEDLHPKHLLYHVPKYLRGVDKNERHFQVN